MAHSFAIVLIRSEKIRGLYRYWAEKRGGKAMPCRADLDVSEIRPLLSSILVTEIIHDPFRIFYRLVGTDIVDHSLQNFTGKHLHEVDPKTDEDWAECYRLVSLRKRPLFGRFEKRRRDGLVLPGEFGFFPLSEDGATVNQCFAVLDFESVAQRAA